MKRRKKLFGLIVSICMLIPVWSVWVHAAGTAQVTLNNPSGNVGSTVTVTGTVSASENMAGANIILSYDQSKLSYVSGGSRGGAGSVQIFLDLVDAPTKRTTFSIKFKILVAGSSRINFETGEITADSTTEDMAVTSGGGTVTGKVPTPSSTKDGNNQLSSLQIHPGTLTPGFQAETTSYSVTVPEDTTDVTISAKAQNSKAQVTVSGGKNLQLGANTAQVIVIAENGASRAYTITIMRGEPEIILINGVEYTIKENFTDAEIPAGFSRTKLTYKERQYEGVANANGSVKLLLLESMSYTNFFVYNEGTQEFSDFLQVAIGTSKYIVLMPLDKSIKDFEKKEVITVTMHDKHFEAWKLDEEFSVCYVINQDGEAALYRYDSVDGMFQRYKEIVEVDDQDAKKALFPNSYYMYAIIGLGALVIILAVSIIYFIASRKQRHEGRKRQVVKHLEKQRRKEAKQAEKQRLAEEKQHMKAEKKAAKENK